MTSHRDMPTILIECDLYLSHLITLCCCAPCISFEGISLSLPSFIEPILHDSENKNYINLFKWTINDYFVLVSKAYTHSFSVDFNYS